MNAPSKLSINFENQQSSSHHNQKLLTEIANLIQDYGFLFLEGREFTAHQVKREIQDFLNAFNRVFFAKALRLQNFTHYTMTYLEHEGGETEIDYTMLMTKNGHICREEVNDPEFCGLTVSDVIAEGDVVNITIFCTKDFKVGALRLLKTMVNLLHPDYVLEKECSLTINANQGSEYNDILLFEYFLEEEAVTLAL